MEGCVTSFNEHGTHYRLTIYWIPDQGNSDNRADSLAKREFCEQ